MFHQWVSGVELAGLGSAGRAPRRGGGGCTSIACSATPGVTPGAAGGAGEESEAGDSENPPLTTRMRTELIAQQEGTATVRPALRPIAALGGARRPTVRTEAAKVPVPQLSPDPRPVPVLANGSLATGAHRTRGSPVAFPPTSWAPAGGEETEPTIATWCGVTPDSPAVASWLEPVARGTNVGPRGRFAIDRPCVTPGRAARGLRPGKGTRSYLRGCALDRGFPLRRPGHRPSPGQAPHTNSRRGGPVRPP